MGITLLKAEQPLQRMKLQGNDEEKNEKLSRKLFKRNPKMCQLALDLKPFRS